MSVLDRQIDACDRELETQAHASEPARRLTGVPGVGPITALAAVATVGDARDYRAIVALAAKNARIIWALLARATTFKTA